MTTDVQITLTGSTIKYEEFFNDGTSKQTRFDADHTLVLQQGDRMRLYNPDYNREFDFNLVSVPVEASPEDLVDTINTFITSGSGGTGDVTGPGSSLQHHIASYADGTGKVLEQFSQVFVQGISSSDDPFIGIKDDLGALVQTMSANLLTNENFITAGQPLKIEVLNSGDLTFETVTTGRVITTSAGDIQMSSSAGSITNVVDTSAQNISFTGTGHGARDHLLKLTTAGTNGSFVDLFIGDNNPEGSTAATNGFHFRGDGVNTTLYLKRTVGGNTGWEEVLHTGTSGLLTGAGVTGRFTYWTGTSVIDDTDSYDWFVSGTQRATVLNSPSGTGIIGHQLHISTGGIRAAWEFNESIQSTDFVHAGTGNFRIAQDNTASSGDLQIQNNGTTGGNISLTTAAASSTISLASGSAGQINFDPGLGTWTMENERFFNTASGASTQARIQFYNNSSIIQSEMTHLHGSALMKLEAYSLNDIELQTSHARGRVTLFASLTPDTDPGMRIIQGGLNGANISLHTSTRQVNTVTQNWTAGAVVISSSGDDADIYINRSSSLSQKLTPLKGPVSAVIYKDISTPTVIQPLTTSFQRWNCFTLYGINEKSYGGGIVQADKTNNKIDYSEVIKPTGDDWEITITMTIRATTSLEVNFQVVNAAATHLEETYTGRGSNFREVITITGEVKGGTSPSEWALEVRANNTGTIYWNAVHFSAKRLT